MSEITQTMASRGREKKLFLWDSLLKMSIFALVKFKHNKQ